MKKTVNGSITQDLFSFKTDPSRENAIRVITDIKMLKSVHFSGEQYASEFLNAQIDRRMISEMSDLMLAYQNGYSFLTEEAYEDALQDISHNKYGAQEEKTDSIVATNYEQIESFYIPDIDDVT